MSVEVIEPPSEEVLEKVRSEFGLNERRVREAVELLKNWIELQPHLPKEINEGRLERWLIRCKNSIEKVKMTLDLYYTVRTNIPEIMTGWDTKGDWFKRVWNSFICLPMPQLTPEYERVTIYAILNPDAAQFNVLENIRLCQFVQEIRMSEDYCRADIVIFDIANYTLAHVPKVTFADVKKYELCCLSGYNTRIKALHILNAGPWAQNLIAMLKFVLKPKIAGRIRVHSKDCTSFYEEVPKETLPMEYGGTCGSVTEHWGRWIKKMESYHDIFLEREKQKSDESKRPGHTINSSDLLGFEGSFRKLDVD